MEMMCFSLLKIHEKMNNLCSIVLDYQQWRISELPSEVSKRIFEADYLVISKIGRLEFVQDLGTSSLRMKQSLE